MDIIEIIRAAIQDLAGHRTLEKRMRTYLETTTKRHSSGRYDANYSKADPDTTAK